MSWENGCNVVDVQSVGEMTPPWGTPSLILTLSLMYSSSLTLSDLSCRKQRIHLYILPDTWLWSTFSSPLAIPCQTLPCILTAWLQVLPLPYWLLQAYNCLLAAGPVSALVALWHEWKRDTFVLMYARIYLSIFYFILYLISFFSYICLFFHLTVCMYVMYVYVCNIMYVWMYICMYVMLCVYVCACVCVYVCNICMYVCNGILCMYVM